VANPQKGEVSVTIDGKPYTLALTLNAMVEVEDMFGVPFSKVCEECENDSPKHIRALVWAVLRKHHKELTVEDVGEMVDLGTLKALSSVLGRVVSSSGPDAKDLPKKGKSENPTKARAGANGTGASSTSPHDASA
jgi:hypothetical protein